MLTRTFSSNEKRRKNILHFKCRFCFGLSQYEEIGRKRKNIYGKGCKKKREDEKIHEKKNENEATHKGLNKQQPDLIFWIWWKNGLFFSREEPIVCCERLLFSPKLAKTPFWYINSHQIPSIIVIRDVSLLLICIRLEFQDFGAK